MNLTEVRHLERTALLRTLRDVGPDAPTLCSDWTASDLAAHLVASERYGGLPMVAAYELRSVLPASLVRRGMRSLQTIGDRELRKAKAAGWDGLLGRLAFGPPAAYRLAMIAPIRLVEEWVHHEDILRANASPLRTSSPQLDEALWQAGLLLTKFAEFLPGREGLEIVLPDGRSRRLGDKCRVRLEGAPGEVLLFLAGRTTATHVTITGDDEAIKALDLAV